MTEKMGFEIDKRIRKDYGTEKFQANIGGSLFWFDSQGEYEIALWLDWRRCSGAIRCWGREGFKYNFLEKTTPHIYIPDFDIVGKDGSLTILEYKTIATLDQAAIKKFRRMSLYYPDVKIDLVLDRITPGIGSNKRLSASKYVRQIIDFSQIKKELKGKIKFGR